MKNYSEDVLLKIVRGIAQRNNFSNNIQMTLGKGSEKFDGFMGEILTLNVTDQESEQKLHLVAKVSLKDEKYRNCTVIAESYENEIIAYEEIFPAMEEVRREFKISEPIQSLVKFYFASHAENEEVIIMENIRESGFQMLPIEKLLGEEEVKSVFKQYAELHANSFALKIFRPQVFEKMVSKNVNVFRLMIDKKISKNFISHLHSIRDVLKERGFEHVLLDNYVKDTLDIWRKVLDFSEEKYVCFSHGDSWSNNMMFRYEMKNGQQTLSDIKLLDWQGWTIGPPVIDLMFCLYSSCSKEVLKNFETHLNIYYANLSRALAMYNLEAKEIYPFQVLKMQMEKYYHFPLMFGIMIRKIRSFDDDHKIDPSSYSSDDGSTYFDAVVESEFDGDYLLENVKYVFDHIDIITKRKYKI